MIWRKFTKICRKIYNKTLSKDTFRVYFFLALAYSSFLFLLRKFMKVTDVSVQPLGTGGGTTQPPPEQQEAAEIEPKSDSVKVSDDAAALMGTGGGTTQPPP